MSDTRLTMRRPNYLLQRLSRFAVVGMVATAIYAICAMMFMRWETRLTPAEASFLAYVLAAIFSYVGHKFVTFMSSGCHRFEAPRFAILTLSGFAVAYTLPQILTVRLGLPHAVPVLVTCVVVPLVNFVMLDRWVFSAMSAREADGR
jgi:putative flippase GtrA